METLSPLSLRMLEDYVERVGKHREELRTLHRAAVVFFESHRESQNSALRLFRLATAAVDELHTDLYVQMANIRAESADS